MRADDRGCTLLAQVRGNSALGYGAVGSGGHCLACVDVSFGWWARRILITDAVWGPAASALDAATRVWIATVATVAAIGAVAPH